jgi:hypothetical protein
MSPASDVVRRAASDAVIGGGLARRRHGWSPHRYRHDMPEQVGSMVGPCLERSLAVHRFPGPEAGAAHALCRGQATDEPVACEIWGTLIRDRIILGIFV